MYSFGLHVIMRHSPVDIKQVTILITEMKTFTVKQQCRKITILMSYKARNVLNMEKKKLDGNAVI